jgi:p-hydroxybenzoate 3-monooxygenase
MVEGGFNLADGDRLIRIDITALTGKHVTVYGQTEVTRDLYDAAAERGLEIVFEASDVALHDVDSAQPSVSYVKDGQARTIEADFIAGCDGFHGASRKAIPVALRREFERASSPTWRRATTS